MVCESHNIIVSKSFFFLTKCGNICVVCSMKKKNGCLEVETRRKEKKRKENHPTKKQGLLNVLSETGWSRQTSPTFLFTAEPLKEGEREGRSTTGAGYVCWMPSTGVATTSRLPGNNSPQPTPEVRDADDPWESPA